jgi:SagB-type dehydrogenase family enzyme
MMTIRYVVPLVLAAAAAMMCLAAGTSRPASTLPPPVTKGTKSLEEVLAARRSVRQFQPTPLTIEQIGQLCWAAQGVTEPTRGLRTAPSAMAKYPLELYVATADGVSHYVPATHTLQPQADPDAWAVVQASSSRQPSAHLAPAVFIVAADASRFGARFGGDLTKHFADLETGHATQNLLLQAVALGLGAVPVAGFDKAAVSAAIHLPEGQSIVYLIPVGVPAQ